MSSKKTNLKSAKKKVTRKPARTNWKKRALAAEQDAGLIRQTAQSIAARQTAESFSRLQSDAAILKGKIFDLSFANSPWIKQNNTIRKLIEAHRTTRNRHLAADIAAVLGIST